MSSQISATEQQRCPLFAPAFESTSAHKAASWQRGFHLAHISRLAFASPPLGCSCNQAIRPAAGYRTSLPQCTNGGPWFSKRHRCKVLTLTAVSCETSVSVYMSFIETTCSQLRSTDHRECRAVRRSFSYTNRTGVDHGEWCLVYETERDKKAACRSFSSTYSLRKKDAQPCYRDP